MTTKEAQTYVQKLIGQVDQVTGAEVVLCVPYTVLAAIKDDLEETMIHLGAQNMSWAEGGAYTGEISAAMLLDLACTYVIIGHSERRMYNHETDEEISRKIKAALRAGLTPILCVGENLAQREEGRALGMVRSQVQKDLGELSAWELKKVVIAYEPIWAIGTGRTASSKDAQEMCSGIRSTLAGIWGLAAEEVCILYGGSVKGENIGELMDQPDIDGALVGGASLDPDGFAQLIVNGQKKV